MKIDDYLFARWLVMHYHSSYLNNITGDKWKELYMYYNRVVKPNYKENGSYKDNEEFMKTPPIEREHEKIVYKEKIVYRDFGYSNGCDCMQMNCVICHG
jgi:hypothetical protein